jgi:6-phosphogluconolactonase
MQLDTRLPIGLLLVGATLLMPSLSEAQKAPSKGEYFVYFGTYTGPNSKGIYVSRYDAKTGKLGPATLAAEIVRPSFLALHPNGRFLYSVSELGNNGEAKGSVTSYAIDFQNGSLKALNTVSSGGGGACHLVVDKTGKMLMVANYGTGSAASFPVNADGSLGAMTSLMQHSGSSVNPQRQRGPHAHAVVLSADNRFLFVPDLGLDQIRIYKIDPAKASLTPNTPEFATVKPGTGPRHFAFHPNGKFAYALGEMGSSVTVFSYDSAAGSLTELQNISTLPADFKGVDNSAEIEVDHAGRFLYASNRGHDSITVFAIDPKKGTLTTVQNVSTEGKTPRNFNIDPTGHFLLAANENSNNVVVFKVDQKTGHLTSTGEKIDVTEPVCVLYVPVGK